MTTLMDTVRIEAPTRPSAKAAARWMRRGTLRDNCFAL